MTDRARPLVVEVVARQGPTIVDVTVVGGRAGAYRIGEGPRAQATVAVPAAEADGCFALVVLRGGSPLLRVPAGATGELQAGAAEGRPLVAGEAIELVDGTCAIVHVGPLTFELRAGPAEPAVKWSPVIEWPLWLAQAASLALFLTLALLIRIWGPTAEAPRWDDPELQERLIRYTAALPPPPPPPDVIGEVGRARPREPIARAPRPTPSEPATSESPDAPAVTGSRGQDPEDRSREAGFLGLAEFDRILREYTASLDVSIRNYATSPETDSAWAAATRTVPRAIAGLGLGETLRGGGGVAEAVIDLDLGELFAGLEARRKRGPPGTGRKEAAFTKAAVPEVRETPRQSVEWTAAVGQDLIRGVIRRHTPEVRKCFREGPATGKVEVAFTIGSGGKVRAAAIEASTIDHAGVQDCITTAVKSWTFPTIVAAAGDVAVRYPFSVG
ncbi:AgmX/PglI C-terminal domain-containing protein [Nannocystis bainbridge]|uniref:AgmX/PglI C-terminal domain-containing protein n=1 Tax=Nannocystis bainbridge TaxID=2995303 RepID=A0ABT5E512_9BACT|nr:AgmX/PglI C-terminal domain-containing protein [Nannocystis bainbridge]MDC0719836.1 AgmX/PglI C-terminal domain-containing protein [Nannocystis bainbridge]